MTFLSDIDLQQFRSGIGTILMKTSVLIVVLIAVITVEGEETIAGAAKFRLK
jgi:hypothetical protein